MKKGFIDKTIFALISTLVLCIGMAAAPAMAADATVAVDIASAYVWRGQTFNDGAVIQPSLDVATENGFGFNVWCNYDISDYNNTLDSREFSEVDLTASYAFSLDRLNVGVGIIAYLFPAGAEETTELYLSLGMDIVDGLSIALDSYYDVEAVNEFTYSKLSLAYAYDITEAVNIEAGGSIGYAGDDFAKNAGGDDGGLYDYSLSLSLGYTISKAWSISAGVTYTDALDDDNLKETSDGGLLDTNTYFTVGIAYAF